MQTPTAAPQLTLRRLVILVHDYDEALIFYKRAFGASVLFDSASPGGDRYLHIAFGVEEGQTVSTLDAGAGIGVWLLRASSTEAERVGRQTGGQPVAVFYTTDVGAAVARSAAAGAAVVRPVQTADGAKFAHVTDLYGNEFVLVQLSGENPDEASDR